ncbi:MAG: IS66 family insertion sequence element accessory protein TnpA, partial [Terracidiphilus sp.]
ASKSRSITRLDDYPNQRLPTDFADEAYVQSGLSRSEFCRQQGLPLSTFNKYDQRARQRDAVASRPLAHNAVALARVEFVEKSATHTVQHAALQVELVGGRRISVPSGFDAASLTRLITVLEQA